jgi:hypothetical protein
MKIIIVPAKNGFLVVAPIVQKTATMTDPDMKTWDACEPQ